MDWKDALAGLLTEEDKEQLVAEAQQAETATSAPAKAKKLPRLRLMLDKRKGKTATIVLGMENETDEAVNALAKTLKTRLAVGGSDRDGEILLQGDIREKAKTLLLELGYRI